MFGTYCNIILLYGYLLCRQNAMLFAFFQENFEKILRNFNEAKHEIF